METIFQLLTYIITNHGYGAAIIFIAVVSLPTIAIAYILYSRSSLAQVIDSKFSEKLEIEKSSHIHGNRLRKHFTVAVQETLQDLAEKTNSNRAVIFEFSNGTTNLVGLPFLFMTAAAEVASPGLSLISQRHQRLNTSTIANFLVKLEKEGHIFIDCSEKVPEEYKVLEQIMIRANIGSALFYSIQGVDEAIGFLVIVTTKTSYNTIDYPKVLPLLSKASQQISSMINFDEIEEREKEKTK